MSELRDDEVFVLPYKMCQSAIRTASAWNALNKAAVDELAVLNRELGADFIDGVHSLGIFANEFWHARTAVAAFDAVRNFFERQERILRREAHRSIEHSHRILDGTLHPSI